MSKELKYSQAANTYVNKYSDIYTKGYFDIGSNSKSRLDYNNNSYKLTRIYVKCNEALEINTLYFVHENLNNSTQYLYVKVPIKVDTKFPSDTPKYSTYPDIRKFLKSLRYTSNQNATIEIDINSSTLNDMVKTSDQGNPKEQSSSKDITQYSFTNSQNGNAVLVIQLADLITSVHDPKPALGNIPGLVKPTFNDENILDKNNIEPSNQKEGFTETFVEGNTPKTITTCKRKGTTGGAEGTAVINNTIMGTTLASKLIDTQKEITIAGLVSFFVCLLIVAIAYLFMIIPDEAPGASLSGGGMIGGMGELCSSSENKIVTGYLFIIGIGCVFLNFYGALYLKYISMFYIGLILVVCTVAYYIRYVYKNLTLFDLELEHVILYNRTKPFVKWMAISTHYIGFSLLYALTFNKEVATTSFIILQVLYIICALASYALYVNYDMLFSVPSVIAEQTVETNQSIFGKIMSMITYILFIVPNAFKTFPVILILLVGMVSNFILSFTNADFENTDTTTTNVTNMNTNTNSTGANFMNTDTTNVTNMNTNANSTGANFMNTDTTNFTKMNTKSTA
jgi:hypothetical protein